ncbi:hypothetical protein [Wolbachia endosymbiont of Atemnus politus]|uniref:hypothetical protein n=1 Tax=Wolbachia endosymbiont of Atemnus politus TaxID=2682840 RepID=UPI001FE4C53D|nr:hypothetical protein [Wolbachia endosymbiont of Atemnus politus]
MRRLSSLKKIDDATEKGIKIGKEEGRKKVEKKVEKKEKLKLRKQCWLITLMLTLL